MPYYLMALKDGPAFFRHLNIAIPISIAEDGHEFVSRWARRLPAIEWKHFSLFATNSSSSMDSCSNSC